MVLFKGKHMTEVGPDGSPGLFFHDWQKRSSLSAQADVRPDADTHVLLFGGKPA